MAFHQLFNALNFLLEIRIAGSAAPASDKQRAEQPETGEQEQNNAIYHQSFNLQTSTHLRGFEISSSSSQVN